MSKVEHWAIYLLHLKHGNKWATISRNLDNTRASNNIKNYMYNKLKKRVKEMQQVLQSLIERTISQTKESLSEEERKQFAEWVVMCTERWFVKKVKQ